MRYLRYFITGAILLILQSIFVPLVSIEKIKPDVLIPLIVYISLKEGQIAGTVSGFIAGLLMDLLGDGLLGLYALSKTIGGFTAGYFYNEKKIDINFETLRFPAIIFLTSIIHNATFFSIDLMGKNVEAEQIIFKFILGEAIYTAVISLIPMFTFANKR
jgi:rod shape-determining protein MreD